MTLPLRRTFVAVVSCVFAIGVSAQSIITFAGGRNDDDRSATAAALGPPIDVALDSAGNVYIADADNNCIRKIDKATGTITTVAGGLEFPAGVALDAANNLYIADSNNDRVRRVDAVTQVITTVAEVSGPSRIAIDAAGNLFVTQQDACRISRIDAVTKTITTIAGTGTLGFGGDGGPATSAVLNSPAGISIATNGDVIFADSNNYRVRKIDAATGTITTIAGNGSFGQAGDNGPATSANLAVPTDVKFDRAGNLIITDFLGHRIRKVDAATKVITTIAGVAGTGGFAGDGGPATSARFNLPLSTAIDSAGNLYVADNRNFRVRRIDAATNVVTTIAGSGEVGDGDAATAAQILQPTSLALDAAGNAYVSDRIYGRIRRIDATTHLASTVYASPGQSALTGLAVDPAGNIYFVDAIGGRVSKIDATTKAVTAVAGGNFPGFSGDNGPATSAQLSPSGQTAMAFDAAGNLFIADTFNHRIRRIDAATKVITTVAGNGSEGFSGDNGPATAAMLSNPEGVAVDRDGNIYIVDAGNYRLRRVDAASKTILTVAGSTFGFAGDGTFANAAKFANPLGITIDASHNIYIADTANNRIRKIDGTTNVITTVAGNGTAGFTGDGSLATSARLNEPSAVAIDASGKLYIADTNNNRIRVLTTIPTHRRPTRR